MKSSNSEKFWLKPLKIAIFGPNLHKKGSVRATPKTNRIFFSEMTKADHELSKTFYFIKISCFDWVMNVFLFCGDFFLLKRVISSHNNCVTSDSTSGSISGLTVDADCALLTESSPLGTCVQFCHQYNCILYSLPC